MKIYLDMVGCRLNQSEIETLARQFCAAGHTLAVSPEEADLVVINTCAVTNAAASDSRQKIRQAARAGNGQIIVTGCWSTLFPDEAASLPQVSKLVPNQAKDRLVADLMESLGQRYELEPICRQPIPGGRLRTRAFIKVQDGCDNHCTFCITVLARGQGHSRSVHDVIEDIQAALADDAEHPTSAAREVVLTGVHLGSWGQDLSQPLNLHQLVGMILKYTNVERLRLSSLEPWDLDEDFFALWENPRLCSHLHLPLQSGSAGVLHRMARKVTPDTFTSLLNLARKSIPEVAITTDLIAGFPGESDTEFAESLSFISEMAFAGGHVFTYSARPGTAAARMYPQVPHPIRKERSARLRQVLEEAGKNYRMHFLGKTLAVLWESARSSPEGWIMQGLTGNYIRVTAIAPLSLWNQITPVHLDKITTDGMQGEIVDHPSVFTT
jgi:threonylcarbamoyladenosine tRNA methylthiotransferase MtaB